MLIQMISMRTLHISNSLFKPSCSILYDRSCSSRLYDSSCCLTFIYGASRGYSRYNRVFSKILSSISDKYIKKFYLKIKIELSKAARKVIYSKPFMICCYNIVAVFLNLLWYPDNVSSIILLVGASSAIYYIFFAISDEERILTLIYFIFNNLTVFLILQMPDPCCFLVGLFLLMLASFHLLLFFSYDLIFDFIFIAVLLYRIFYHHQIALWGFSLVTELMFIRLFFKLCLKKEVRSEEGSRIEPLFYLIPFFGISFINLIYLDYGLMNILIHILFLFADAALIFFTFFANRKQELIISFILYNLGNLAIGYNLSISLMTFFQISAVFLVTNGMFASVYFMKARRLNKPLFEILVANNREGIQSLLLVYILILEVLLTQLNPGSTANGMYSNWIVWLGMKIGFLTALNFLLKK